MDRFMDGWKNLTEVRIPPVKERGFKEDIIIRKKIEPIILQKTVVLEPVIMEESTVLLSNIESEKEKNTIPIQQKVVSVAFIKRIRTGEEIQIGKESFIIGKGSKSDYVIQGNQTISRTHITVTYENGEYYMEDMQSANHTYINDKRIDHKVKLEDGITFKLADEVFVFEIRQINQK